MVALDLPALGAGGRDQFSAAGEFVEIFNDDVGIEDDIAIVQDQHRQLLQRRDLRIFLVGLTRRDGCGGELDLVDQAGLDRSDADFSRERRGGGEGEFHGGNSLGGFLLILPGHDDRSLSSSPVRNAHGR
jgi:hypothetical protein